MAKNDLILLDSILEEYIANKKPTADVGEVFEYFATEQILKDYAFTEEQLSSGSVDGRNDGGIDEFFVLVNGHLAESIPKDFWPKSNAELEIYIITCKHDASFKQAPITAVIASLMELLDFSIPSTNLGESYNELLLGKRELLMATYKRLATALVKFDIHIIYACRGNEDIEDNIQAKADQAEQICKDSFSDCTVTFSFWGNSKLLAKYREQPNSALELEYEQCINQNGQYVVLTTLKKYCDFITDSNGNLNKHLFDANVRDYLGLNPVNVDISRTLKDSGGPNFWWLNNGITVIGSKAHIIGNSISIDNVQIVNGLQTSESIFNYFSEGELDSGERSVLIKILISDDMSTCNAIIYATNNQTNVNVTALRANDKIQRDIEAVLKKHEIYYERRTNHYQHQGIPQQAIINPLSLAAGYICLIYKNPYVATSLKQKFMRDNKKYGQVFSATVDLNVWVPIAILIKKTDKFLAEIRKEMDKNVVKFLKNYRHIAMFITVARLMGTFAFNEQQLIKMDLELYTKEEVEKSLVDLQETDSRSFTQNTRLPTEFYTKCFKHVGDKYSIECIQAIRSNNRKLWYGDIVLSNYNLSEDMVNKILDELPPQPWGKNVHQHVSQKLGLEDITVSNAIAYLVYTEKVYAQVYGYVFDRDNRIVLEGEHYGHTEEEARKTLETQRTIHEKKFRF